MTDAVTILAPTPKAPSFSKTIYMESITTNREDEPFIWVLKADLAACIVFYRNLVADTAAAGQTTTG